MLSLESIWLGSRKAPHPGLDPAAAPSNERWSPEHTGRMLLLLGAALLCIACLRDLNAPWGTGLRGGVPAYYTAGAVSHTLKYGLGVTLGMPAFVSQVDGQLVREVNWHHPPGYWLYLSAWAGLLGEHMWVLRLAHLSLFFPALFALFACVRRAAGPRSAGYAAVLFAATPMVAHYGSMALQDGAVLSFGLVTVASFLRYLDVRTRSAWWATAAAFFLACSIDHNGHFWGIAMFVAALGRRPRWDGVKAVLSLFPISVAAFAIMSLHYGVEYGGPVAFWKKLFGALAEHPATPTTSMMIRQRVEDELFAHGSLTVLALALLGGYAACRARSRQTTSLAHLGLALLVPGIANCAAQPRHFVDHTFWTLQGYAGVACLGAIVVVAANRRRRPDAVDALRARSMQFAFWAVVAFGAVQTHALLNRFAAVDNGTDAFMSRAAPWLDGCARGLTSAPRGSRRHVGGAEFYYSIDTVQKLDTLIAFAVSRDIAGEVAFVLHPDHRDSPLSDRLDRIAARLEAENVWIYRFTVDHLRLLLSRGADSERDSPATVIRTEIFAEAASLALDGAEVLETRTAYLDEPVDYVGDVKPIAIGGLTELLGPVEGHDEYCGIYQADRRDYLVDAALLADEAAVRKFFSGLLGAMTFHVHHHLHDLKGPNESDNAVHFEKLLEPRHACSARLHVTYKVPSQVGGYEFVLMPAVEDGKRRICCYHYAAPVSPAK